MPGTPRLQVFEQYVSELGGDQVVFDLIADGRKMEEVAATFRGVIPSEPDFPSRTWMYTWIKAGGEERREAWEEAKEIAAHNILDDLDEEIENSGAVLPAEVSLLKLRAQRAESRAAAFFPEMYGEKKEAAVQILSVGELHLDALRKAGSRELAPSEEPAQVEGEVLNAEVVEDAE